MSTSSPGRSGDQAEPVRPRVGVAAVHLTDDELHAALRLADDGWTDDEVLIEEGRRRGWWQ